MTPLLSAIARAIFPFENSMEKTTGSCSSLTLSIKNAIVEALGSESPVEWTRDAEGLHIVSDRTGDYPVAFRITIE